MDVEHFVPGLDLAEAFYREAVRPILDRHYPGQVHSAALLGYGSEALGYDTPLSYLVIHSGRFVDALRARIRDPLLVEVAVTGCADQFVDSTNVLSYPARYARLRAFFGGP